MMSFWWLLTQPANVATKKWRAEGLVASGRRTDCMTAATYHAAVDLHPPIHRVSEPRHPSTASPSVAVFQRSWREAS